MRCVAGIILKLTAHNAEERLYLIHVNMTFWMIKGDQNKGLQFVIFESCRQNNNFNECKYQIYCFVKSRKSGTLHYI